MQYCPRISPNTLMQISLIRQGFKFCVDSLRQSGKVKGGWKGKSHQQGAVTFLALETPGI